MLEHVQSVRPITAQLWTKTAGIDGALVRLEELGVDLAGRAHAERREHQVARGHAFPGTEVGSTFAGGALEAVDGAIGAFTRTAVPVMPAGTHEFL